MDRRYGDFEQVNGAVVNDLRDRIAQLEKDSHPPATNAADADDMERWLRLVNDRLRRIEAHLGLSGWGAPRPGLFPAPQGMARLDGRPHYVNEFGKEVDDDLRRE